MRITTAVALAGGLSLALAAPALANDDATVYILHGVPDATVDVYINGDASWRTSRREP